MERLCDFANWNFLSARQEELRQLSVKARSLQPPRKHLRVLRSLRRGSAAVSVNHLKAQWGEKASASRLFNALAHSAHSLRLLGG